MLQPGNLPPHHSLEQQSSASPHKHSQSPHHTEAAKVDMWVGRWGRVFSWGQMDTWVDGQLDAKWTEGWVNGWTVVVGGWWPKGQSGRIIVDGQCWAGRPELISA